MSETEIKGLLGKKLGMTQIFDENNHVVPVTVVEAGPCVITQIRTQETDGYTAIQIAYGDIDPRKVKKPQAGHLTKLVLPPGGTWRKSVWMMFPATNSARKSPQTFSTALRSLM